MKRLDHIRIQAVFPRLSIINCRSSVNHVQPSVRSFLESVVPLGFPVAVDHPVYHLSITCVSHPLYPCDDQQGDPRLCSGSSLSITPFVVCAVSKNVGRAHRRRRRHPSRPCCVCPIRDAHQMQDQVGRGKVGIGAATTQRVLPRRGHGPGVRARARVKDICNFETGGPVRWRQRRNPERSAVDRPTSPPHRIGRSVTASLLFPKTKASRA
jgi:hypothetical protein